MSDKDKSNKLLVVIGGPTGVGKTMLAIQLAQYFQSEIINADSRQIYTELNIGVGKPTNEQLAIVPHHLIGSSSIHNSYTAGHFVKEAMEKLEILFQKHDIVFLVGGTGLYIKGLVEGFDDFPEIPDDVKEYWTNVYKETGLDEILSILKNEDPEYYHVVDKANHMRLIRAVSVIRHSGRKFSSFQTGIAKTNSFNVMQISLTLPREELYERINQRVIIMISNGWLEEAKYLIPYRDLKALDTVGYKELFQVIDGKLPFEQAIPMIQQSTRRYAKRQMTWWRNQGHWIHVDVNEMERIIQLINAHR